MNDAGLRAVNFFERALVHTKGEYSGAPFILEEWQRDIILKLFGTLLPDGRRQYRKCYAEIPRKNGKSELAAGVALYLLFMDGEQSGEIYGAAADREQASIVFNTAAQMIRLSPLLSERSKIVDSKKTIAVPSTNSFYRALPADAHSAHGYNPSAIIFDELHTQKKRDLWDTLQTSMGSEARRHPMTFAITTAGFDRKSICYEQHEYAIKVRDGVIDDETFLPVIYAADDTDDWLDEKVWHKANPALKTFRSIEEMRAAAKRAKHIPAEQNTFRRLYLNQWTEQETKWLDMRKWRACDGRLQYLFGMDCYCGLDLASTTDITAFVAVFPVDDAFQVLCKFWMPSDAIKEREQKDGIPFSLWARQGLITATPGNVMDYDFCRRDINKFNEAFRVRSIAVDRWNAMHLTTQLIGDGFEMVPMGQGFASMSAPMKELNNLILSNQLVHGDNDVLTWMASNVAAKQDAAGNIKPDKEKSMDKIDGVVAMIMGLDQCIRNKDEQKESRYATEGFTFL